MAREMDLGWEASACVGGGVQLKWNDLEICMSPAVRFQGRAIVQLVQHFSFKRCHLVVGPGLAYEQASSFLFSGCRVSPPQTLAASHALLQGR